MQVTCIPFKSLYSNPSNGYKVLACRIAGSLPDGITLNKYGNISISSYDFGIYKMNCPITWDIEPDSKTKYSGSYKLNGLGGLEYQDIITIEESQELNILNSLMTQGQAKACHKAYPHFVQMIAQGKEDEIDVNKIKGVKNKRMESYIAKIRQNIKKIFFMSELKEMGFSNNDVGKLVDLYADVDMIREAMDDNPYALYIRSLDYSFEAADEKILGYDSVWATSEERCKFCALDLMHENELEGNTRLNANVLASAVKSVAPECIDHIRKLPTDWKDFYYDKETKYVSLKETYDAERKIADIILSRVGKPPDCPYEVGELDESEVELTEEQKRILYLLEDNKVAVLTGPGGCVDCDTEFFTGTGWKKISEYKPGDKVLQYNNDGTAELVEPLLYHKYPTDTLWHFETKYGVNQTVSDEHNIVYWSQKGKEHTCHVQDIIAKQEKQGNGWEGKFKTSFIYNGPGIDLTDAEIELMCAVICDGSFYGFSKPELDSWHTCRFHIKKQRKKDRLKEIFDKCNLPYREVQSAAPGYTDLYVKAPRREKEFTEYWYNCSQHQLQIICDNILFWDGNINPSSKGTLRRRFSANVKTTAEFIQFAFSACGYRATLGSHNRVGQQYFACGKWYTRKSEEYNITVTNRNFVGICADGRDSYKKTKIEQVITKDGYKYCFTVPSNKLILRRENCIFVTGNSGKTMSTKALIKVLDKCSLTYTLLAPTGIASKVLSKYTGRQASTIHKYLVSHDMCTTDFLLIDEASMVGITLMAELFDKVGRSTSIVFICDEAQLASISCGNLVHDILNSEKVPVARLTKIFRYNSSGIITMATDAREGNCDHLLEKYDDAEFIEIDNAPIEQVKLIYQKYLDMGYTKDDIMVLSPFNVYGAGTYVINDAIQPIANPKGVDREFINMPIGKYPQKFTIGDKVLNTKNNYEAKGLELDESGDTQIINTSIFNGDLGTITAIFEEHAPFADIEDTDCPAVVVQFDSGQILFDAKELRNLRLGYAESCHKIQGSQAKAVIVVIDSSHERLLSSNILYVAFTRCQEHLTIIGDLAAIKEGLKRSEHLERDTWLKDMLLEEYVKHDFMSELDDDKGEIVSDAEMALENFVISPELLDLLGGGDWLDAALYDF